MSATSPRAVADLAIVVPVLNEEGNVAALVEATLHRHGGIAPLDSKGRGKIMAVDVPVDVAGVRICPGDLIVGDADGVVVVPQQRQCDVGGEHADGDADEGVEQPVPGEDAEVADALEEVRRHRRGI